MTFIDLTLEQLKLYKAQCEAYGTIEDVVECEKRIKELMARQ